jgi:hypothetical protein
MTTPPLQMSTLLDNGSHLVIIRDKEAQQLNLHRTCLIVPKVIGLALEQDSLKKDIALHYEVFIEPYDPISGWKSKPLLGTSRPLIMHSNYHGHAVFMCKQNCNRS